MEMFTLIGTATNSMEKATALIEYYNTKLGGSGRADQGPDR